MILLAGVARLAACLRLDLALAPEDNGHSCSQLEDTVKVVSVLNLKPLNQCTVHWSCTLFFQMSDLAW